MGPTKKMQRLTTSRKTRVALIEPRIHTSRGRRRGVAEELLAADGGDREHDDDGDREHEHDARAHEEEGRERHAGDLEADELVGALLAVALALEEVLAVAHAQQPLPRARRRAPTS